MFIQKQKNVLLQCLDRLYQHASLYKASNEELKNNIAKTYGEILPDGIDKIVSSIQVAKDDIFVDLGSGMGKFVVYTFLRTIVKEAIGIELIPELHEQAVLIKQKARYELPEFFQGERKLSFICGDFLKIPFSMATIVLLCSPCYTQQMLTQLAEIINQTPTIHTVLSLRPLTILRRIKFVKTVSVECSWDTALCYVYSSR